MVTGNGVVAIPQQNAPGSPGAFLFRIERKEQLAPVITGRLLICKNGFEVLSLLNKNISLPDWLVKQNGLKTHQLKHCKEHAYKRALGMGVVQ